MSESPFCPVCKNQSDFFESFGLIPRADARCPKCGALERHRLVWLYFTRCTTLFDGAPKRVLHVAPEQAFESRLRHIPGLHYVTADRSDPVAMVRMDLVDINFPAATFDVIYCSHVLEHVPDDRRAMQELQRVLSPRGWAVLNVPVDLTGPPTFEDPSVSDPKERERLFGQSDHVRLYGPDYVERLEAAGFTVAIIRPQDVATKDEIERMRIGSAAAGEVFLCRRARTSQ
jgi:SAM-dependent methyltransferase